MAVRFSISPGPERPRPQMRLMTFTRADCLCPAILALTTSDQIQRTFRIRRRIYADSCRRCYDIVYRYCRVKAHWANGKGLALELISSEEGLTFTAEINNCLLALIISIAIRKLQSLSNFDLFGQRGDLSFSLNKTYEYAVHRFLSK
jgi:hypothetical protein